MITKEKLYTEILRHIDEVSSGGMAPWFIDDPHDEQAEAECKRLLDGLLQSLEKDGMLVARTVTYYKAKTAQQIARDHENTP